MKDKNYSKESGEVDGMKSEQSSKGENDAGTSDPGQNEWMRRLR